MPDGQDKFEKPEAKKEEEGQSIWGEIAKGIVFGGTLGVAAKEIGQLFDSKSKALSATEQAATTAAEAATGALLGGLAGTVAGKAVELAAEKAGGKAPAESDFSQFFQLYKNVSGEVFTDTLLGPAALIPSLHDGVKEAHGFCFDKVTAATKDLAEQGKKHPYRTFFLTALNPGLGVLDA